MQTPPHDHGPRRAAPALRSAPWGSELADAGVHRVVMIGCGGFVGGHLLDAALADRHLHVTGFDPSDDKIRRHLGRDGFTFHKARSDDVDAQPALRAAIQEADAVINLAAVCTPAAYVARPLDVIRSNALDVAPIIDLCAEANAWLIHFSTSEVYGRMLGGERDMDAALHEDESPLIAGPVPQRRWCYGSAKQLLERYIEAHAFQSGLRATVIRPFNFFGPRMDFLIDGDADPAHTPRVLPAFMSALLSGAPMRLVDGGRARRTIVSIYDAVRAVGLMLAQPERAVGQTFNIGNPTNEITIADLAHRMRALYAEICDDAGILQHPIEAVTGAAFYGAGYADCDRRMPSIEKARTRLGWEPTLALDDILRDAIAWYRAEAARRAAAA